MLLKVTVITPSLGSTVLGNCQDVCGSARRGRFSIPKVQRLLEHPDTAHLVSPISFNEIAIKANKELSPLTRRHVEQLICDLDLTVLPLTAEHSFRLFGWPTHHGDPFDRMLIATALAEDISFLVARDREFKKYKGLRVIW